MKPFIGITRFLRPDLPFRVARVPFIALKGISSSTRCKSTLDSPHPLPKLESPDIADTADSSQHTTVANANASGQNPARRLWTPDEQRKLKAAVAEGMSIRAIAALFPTRSIRGVANKRDALLDSEDVYDKTPFRKRQKWSPDEKDLLVKLHADGLKPTKLRAHFPDRSIAAIRRALVNSLDAKAHHRKSAPWSREDDMMLAELAQSKGTNKSAIAKAMGRTVHSIESRARFKGVKLALTSEAYTPEEIATLLQMRHDNAPFKLIAAKLGRKANAVASAYFRYRPFRDSDAKVRETVHVRLPPEELERISTLRTQGVSWPDIGHRYPTHSFESIAEHYRRFVECKLSPDELRECVRLRDAGKTWYKILKLDQFCHFTTTDGLRLAYSRTLEKQKPQQ